jgi:hypothetical protein
MKFKNLTPDDRSFMAKVHSDKTMSFDDRINKLAEYFGIKSERTVRRWLAKLKVSKNTEIEPEILTLAKNKSHDDTKKIFLITSAQNATKAHSGLLKNMEAYAEYLNAEILVIPFRYKNPTSMFTANQENDDWWDSSITKYLTLNRHELNNRISVLSDVKIQPTASEPLQGLEGMTGEHCCVVGHPRLELKTVAVLDPTKPKIMFTTGAITKKNYTDSKAGKKGEFHHSFGFAIVEIKDNDTFFFRQVSANDKSGEFIDLFHSLKDGVVNRETEVEAVAMGDIHVRHCNPRVTDVTLNDLFKKLKPKKVFLHDIIDAESVSHHNLKDPFLLHELELSDRNNLKLEMDEMIEWLKPFQSFDTHIVNSNHDVHIDKYLAENDWRKMVTFKNAITYMEYSLAKLSGKANNGILSYVINSHYPNMKCLKHDDNVVVKGYLMSMHGHLGASGSRGSLKQFSKLSTKTVTGHSHTIGRIGGAVSVGTSTYMNLRYLKGANAWVNSHGIVNRLGKFQHIVFVQTKDGLEYTTIK